MIKQPRFDNREGKIFLNNKFISWEDSKIHTLNHSLHYGSSCFEGIRIYNGKIFKNKEHAERLLFSASTLDLAPEFTPNQIQEICIDLCKKNNILNGYIRPLFWRGSEEMLIGTTNLIPQFSVAAWSWPQYSEQKKMDGKHLIVAKYKRPSPESGPVFSKIGGLYVASTLVKNDATKHGFDDCIMLDYRNYIAESSTSNIFFVFGGEIHTPIADCFLNGITRQTVILLAKELGYKVIERHIKLEEIEKAEDAFLTGTAAEVSKISSVTLRDLKTRYDFQNNQVSHHLIKEYKNLVK